MARHLVTALLVSLLGAAVLADPVEKKNNGADPGTVEVRFADGSVVRMMLPQESLEVVTRYGKLQVPTNEVRRIDFAFRLPEETSRKINTAIADLGHELHARRDAASKELVAQGVLATPALKLATKSGDAEVARRALAAMQQIGGKVPLDQIKFPINDVIQTSEFTIAGQIVNPTIKAHSPYFGDVPLQVVHLRQMRWLQAGGDAVVAVDAARYGSAPDQWMETEFTVRPLEGLSITVEGQVDLWPQGPGQYMTGPGGYGTNRGAHPSGMLLGKIGPNGKVFRIGERYEGTPSEDGRLYLHIVPSPWNNASTGGYTVKIVSKP